MNIKKVVVGCIETNCYLLIKNNECLIIDPGADENKVIKEIGDSKVLGILVTHNHPDHIGVLECLKNHYKCPVFNKNNLEEKEYKMSNFIFDVIYTPGHTDDSITFYFRNNKMMFTGDFLFKGTIGRVDLPTGDYLKMQESLNKIKKYDVNTKVYPGHGDDSLLELECKYNMYLKKRI